MMKSILYRSFFIACLIYLVQPVARAQKHCDLSLHVISPAQGAEIPFGDTVKMVISVRNLGPDDIDSSDAFWLNMEGDPFGTYFSNFNIPAGDSLVYMPFYTLNGQEDSDYHLVLCTYLEVDSNTYVDDNPANDSACMDAILKAKNPNSITNLAMNNPLQLFPNPATGLVTIQIDAEHYHYLQLAVTDVLGRKVLARDYSSAKPAGKNGLVFDVSSLKPGLYFVRLMADSKTYMSKLVVR